MNPGMLHLFVSYAPGAGKTFQMLRCAQAQQQAGKQVIFAFLFQEHRGAYGPAQKGYSLPALLNARPDLIVLDEFVMAGQNIDALDHRVCDDVPALLDRGIDVYSSVNMFHFSSISRICWESTGFCVTNPLPDSLLKQARLTFVDVDPSALAQAYQKGCVFHENKKNPVTDLIFREENLKFFRDAAIAHLQTLTDVTWIRREIQI